MQRKLVHLVSKRNRLRITRDLRQVPDTQEVLLYPNSGVSIVAEVLQSVDANEFVDIARYVLYMFR